MLDWMIKILFLSSRSLHMSRGDREVKHQSNNQNIRKTAEIFTEKHTHNSHHPKIMSFTYCRMNVNNNNI